MSEWIKVKDSLPEDHCEVIGYYPAEKNCPVDCFHFDNDTGTFWFEGYICSVTHWQPLPEPPK